VSHVLSFVSAGDDRTDVGVVDDVLNGVLAWKKRSTASWGREEGRRGEPHRECRRAAR